MKRFQAIGLLLFAGLALSLLAACSRQPTMHVQDGFAIHAPKEITATEAVTIVVGPVDAPDNTPVILIVNGSAGPQMLTVPIQYNAAYFRLTPTDTMRAGTVLLFSHIGDVQSSAQMHIRASAPASPITPIVGPRSITADGKDQTMVTIVPFDEQGNSLPDGTPITVRIAQPNEITPTLKTLSLQNGVAWDRITSNTTAGRAIVTAQAGTAYGPEATFDQVAGQPVTFTLSASPNETAADGGRIVMLRTSVLKDGFGNVLPDGTYVAFVTNADGRQRNIPSYTIAGVAEAALQAPAAPGSVLIQVALYGTESLPITVNFTPGPGTGNININAKIDTKQNSMTLIIGPVVGPLQQLAPDGTAVDVTVRKPSGNSETLRGATREGIVNLQLKWPELEAGTYIIQATSGSASGRTTVSVP